LLYLTYLLIALSATAEYLGVYFDGRAGYPPAVLASVKCADYILTPITGGALVLQLKPERRWKNVLLGLLIFNTVFQIVAAFGGWMIRIDEFNHYTRGPLYVLYIGIYLSIILIVLIQFIIYGRSFRRQNRASLYATILLAIAGIMIQELIGGEARTAYITLTIGAMLLYIHFTEFTSLKMDDYLKKQQIQIDTDALTGVLSRSAYSRALDAYSSAETLPENLAAFTIDINGLKWVNDSIGHKAGDELICGAANCIVKALDASKSCYRTGGDEFVVLTTMNQEEADKALLLLKLETDQWHGEKVKSLSVSVGYALAEDYDNITAEMLVMESDKAMYEAKAAYYQSEGKDRRKRREKKEKLNKPKVFMNEICNQRCIRA
jgi:diguanylate cyclase (GGDEF)-like protein